MTLSEAHAVCLAYINAELITDVELRLAVSILLSYQQEILAIISLNDVQERK